MTQTKDKIPVGGFVFALIVVVSVVWFILPDRWTDPVKYSNRYGIAEDQVHWNDKPRDCDFMYSPLGDKGCHYQKTVTAYNAAGDAVAGDNAPQYGHDRKTGQPVVSYDNKKTWEYIPEFTWDDGKISPEPGYGPPADLKVKTVEIDWVKIAE